MPLPQVRGEKVGQVARYLGCEAADREPGDRPVSRLFARVGRGAPKQWEKDPHAAIAVL
jgi:hypothetical protein